MMRFSSLHALSAAGLLLAGHPAAAPAATLRAEDHYGRIARRVAEQLPDNHLLRRPLDAAVSRIAWTNYFDMLDYERLFFRQSDLERFRGHAATLGDELRDGDVRFAYEVFDLFKQRARERIDYVNRCVSDGFDLTVKETYRWKRKDAPWPADTAEQDDLWRRRLKNEYIQQLIGREFAPTNAPAGTNAVSATNAPARPPPPPATNAAPAAATNAAAALTVPVLTPEESIRRRYGELLTVLEDSDAEFVLQRYLSAFATAYDPHSEYMSPSALDDFNIEMKLSLYGIGAMLRSEEGAAKVLRLIPGGPADRDKRDIRLQPGDKIIGVGQEGKPPVTVLHWPLNKIVKLIRGAKGTRVYLTVIPASDPAGGTTKLVDIERDEVKLEEEAASSKVYDVAGTDGVKRRVGVIALPAFYASLNVQSGDQPGFRSAAYDVYKAIESMRTQAVDGIALDLRNNGGGALLEAIRMVGLFISTGPVVQVKERDSVRILPDRDPAVAYAGPLVLIVNRLSASASEIVAGALQDYGRAVIVGGRKTHGKGTVQTILSVGRDERMGSLKVTTASYYRINGSSTQLRGVAADVPLPSPFDGMDLGEDAMPNAMPWSTVAPARYLPVADLDALIPTLNERSARRVEHDSRFAAFRQLIDRIEAINRNQELPLDMAARREMAKAEKELADLQRQFAPAEGGDDVESPTRDKAAPDLVRDEALHVLADLAELWRTQGIQPPAVLPAPPRTLLDSVQEWIQNIGP